MRYYLKLSIAVFMALLTLSVSSARADLTAGPAESNGEVLATVDFLLAIDRLQFYSQSLADFLEGKKSPELIAALRNLKPEDFYNLQLDHSTFNDHEQWTPIVLAALQNSSNHSNVSSEDLQWNYNFFKKKLELAFTVKPTKNSVKKEAHLKTAPVVPVSRSVRKIKGDKILLDTERYIAEKTTRAIFWDAILNDRGFEFHVGTQREFQERVRANGTEIVAEIKPVARNYNKIYLVRNPATNKYSYAINMISGEDRIRHLTAQLRVLEFQGKQFLNTSRTKIQVFGNVADFQKAQEQALMEIYSQLPVADKVIIGQKGAIDGAISLAGMMGVVSVERSKALEGQAVSEKIQSKFAKLADMTQMQSSFQLEAINSSAIKIDDAYEKAQDPIKREYRQFNSEQPSHEFSDYLLEDTSGKIVRWRVISAVWGDEIIPIARALKNSGHKDVIYIGTAGAIHGRGIKVGDVVQGTAVQTHSAKSLAFSKGNLVNQEASRQVIVGQVHTPFDETDRWLKESAPAMDIVEVETGYLREQLGEQVNLQAYFLISDIVGSDSETLAHAAQSSSKRKRGQLKLLENLFIKNSIKAPISNYQPIPNHRFIKSLMAQLVKLRPSRDELSLLQVAQVAARNGATTDDELEELLKIEPAFDRKQWDSSLTSLGMLLAEIQRSLPKGSQVGLTSAPLLNGTFNPLTKNAVKLTTSTPLTGPQIRDLIGEARLAEYQSVLKRSFDLQFVGSSESVSSLPPMTTGQSDTRFFVAKTAESLGQMLETEVLNKVGYVREIDTAGKYRIKEIPGLQRGDQCKMLF